MILHLLTSITADSSGFSTPQVVGDFLQWLVVVFGGKFVVEEVGSFKSGRQRDSLSCSLFAINAIRHEVLKEPLLNQDRICVEWVKWFDTLCQTTYRTVRRSCFCGFVMV